MSQTTGEWPVRGLHDERRFAPAVREYRANCNGPTAQWAAHVTELEDRQALTRVLWRDGWSVVQIAEYFGVSRRWVSQFVTSEAGAA